MTHHFKSRSGWLALFIAGGVVALTTSEAMAGGRHSARHSRYRPSTTYVRSYANCAPTYYAPRVREVVYTRPVTTSYVYSRPASCEVVRPVYVAPSYSYHRPVVYTSYYNTCRTAPVYYSRPSYSVGVSYYGGGGHGYVRYRR